MISPRYDHNRSQNLDYRLFILLAATGWFKYGVASSPHWKTCVKLALSCPAISGAEPCAGSNTPTHLNWQKVTFQWISIAAASRRMSPNRLLVTMVSKLFGPTDQLHRGIIYIQIRVVLYRDIPMLSWVMRSRHNCDTSKTRLIYRTKFTAATVSERYAQCGQFRLYKPSYLHRFHQFCGKKMPGLTSKFPPWVRAP